MKFSIFSLAIDFYFHFIVVGRVIWQDLIFLNMLRFVFWPSYVIYPREHSAWDWEECAILLSGGVFCMCVRFNWSMALFKTSVSALIFLLALLSIIESGVLKSLTVTVVVSFFPFDYVDIVSYIWVLWCQLHIYL